MSARMVRMLRWIASHPNQVNLEHLRKANQTTLRGLAMRGLVSSTGITAKGMQELGSYNKAEFISRKANGKNLSVGVAAALRLVRERKNRGENRKYGT